MAERAPRKKSRASAAPDVASVVASLERLGTRAGRDGYARYGIVAKKSFGVAMRDVQAVAKQVGRSHALAQALWESGWYEARLLAAFVDEPESVTPAQMDRWCREFDNWGVVDTICFHLFDRTPHAFAKVDAWADEEGEFQKRASFALLACVGAHVRDASDAEFLRRLPLVERGASDGRNFVKKGVSWALRVIGRRNPKLTGAATELAARLAKSSVASARWVGNDALRDFRKVAARSSRG